MLVAISQRHGLIPSISPGTSVSRHRQSIIGGILPPPRKHGGKLMWKWSEVDDRLTTKHNDDIDATGMRDAVRREREADESRAGRR